MVPSFVVLSVKICATLAFFISAIGCYVTSHRGAYSNKFPLLTFALAATLYGVKLLRSCLIANGCSIVDFSGVGGQVSLSHLPWWLDWIVIFIGWGVIMAYVALIAMTYALPPILAASAIGAVAGRFVYVIIGRWR